MAKWAIIVSAILILYAFGWMGWLIVMRVRRDKRRHRRDQARAEALQILVQMVMAPSPELDEKLRPYLKRIELMAALMLEFQDLIRGEEREQVFAHLRAVHLEHAFVDRLNDPRQGRLYLEALAALGGPAAHVALLDVAAGHPDPAMRIAALRHVIDGGLHMPIRALLNDAIEGRLEVSRVYADLVRQVAAADLQAAMAALKDTTLPVQLRVILIDALGASGDYDVLDTLIAAARDEIEIRTAALRALGRLMHPAAEPVIAAGLQDPVWLARSAAAEATGRARLASLAPLVSELLDDPEWWVRFRAGQALAALGDAGREVLQQTAGAGTTLARRTAEAALAEHRAA